MPKVEEKELDRIIEEKGNKRKNKKTSSQNQFFFLVTEN